VIDVGMQHHSGVFGRRANDCEESTQDSEVQAEASSQGTGLDLGDLSEFKVAGSFVECLALSEHFFYCC
jgi:hypothetical protein